MIISAVYLREAVRGAKDYQSELHTLRSFATNDYFVANHIKTLEKTSKSGITPLSALSSQFIETADKILKKSRQEKTDKSLLDKAALTLSSVVHVRKISADDTSTKTEDILARIANHIESGRVDLALKELDGLPAAEKEMLVSWMDKANDFVAIHNASEEIFQHVINSGNRQGAEAKS